MATKPYDQRNGSQTGIIPNKLFLVKVSTPVDTKIDSKMIIRIKPKNMTVMSFSVLCINKEMIIMTTKIAAKI